MLRRGRGGILLGGNALTLRGLNAAARLASATDCRVWIETWPSRKECGRHLPSFPVLPYPPEQALKALAKITCLVLAGVREPVAFFAYPDQPSIQADGSGLYTLQALWSMARESADVTVVVCANRRYHVLQAELSRAATAQPGPKAQALTDLARPVMDWSLLAKGFGVPACSVQTDIELSDALIRALSARGPNLIEAVLV